jgi:hypothetical protein
MTTANLETIKIKFSASTVTEMRFALKDIRECLDIWRDTETDYTKALYAEWDYLVVKLQKLEAK